MEKKQLSTKKLLDYSYFRAMQLREASPTDITAIVQLLRLSLGESMIPKSEKLWNWKHQENPFGKSPVWVAEEKGKLIGVRAFMQWEWMRGTQKVAALRAVDTATHPDFQGKGIFRKLTLQLVEACSTAPYRFIYNTPNQHSLPGYLKMGWKERGKLPLRLAITNPTALLSSAKKPVSFAENWPTDRLSRLEMSNESDQLRTNISLEYIRWRYMHNPLFQYHCLTDGESYCCIFRIKQHRFFRELRISELFSLTPSQGIHHSHLQSQLKEASQHFGASLLSYADDAACSLPSFGPVRFIRLAAGPMVTLRNLTMPATDFNRLLDPQTIAFSLGDLELF